MSTVCFQSSIDCFSACILFSMSLSVINGEEMHSTGWLAQLECKLWNSQVLLWGPLLSSSCNLACLTLERYVIFFS